MPVAICKTCGAKIQFQKTVRGKLMPVELQQRTLLTAGGEITVGFEPHFINCKNYRRNYRRKKNAKKKES
jgi:hypothetical protein